VSFEKRFIQRYYKLFYLKLGNYEFYIRNCAKQQVFKNGSAVKSGIFGGGGGCDKCIWLVKIIYVFQENSKLR
jgi:hypothetical protein